MMGRTTNKCLKISQVFSCHNLSGRRGRFIVSGHRHVHQKVSPVDRDVCVTRIIFLREERERQVSSFCDIEISIKLKRKTEQQRGSYAACGVWIKNTLKKRQEITFRGGM